MPPRELGVGRGLTNRFGRPAAIVCYFSLLPIRMSALCRSNLIFFPPVYPIFHPELCQGVSYRKYHWDHAWYRVSKNAAQTKPCQAGAKCSENWKTCQIEPPPPPPPYCRLLKGLLELQGALLFHVWFLRKVARTKSLIASDKVRRRITGMCIWKEEKWRCGKEVRHLKVMSETYQEQLTQLPNTSAPSGEGFVSHTWDLHYPP